MPEYVHCRYCGKTLDRQDAVSVPHGKVNFYYCPEHASFKSEKELLYGRIEKILPSAIHSYGLFNKVFSPLFEQYPIPLINKYLDEKETELTRLFLRKEFSSEMNCFRYLKKVMENQLKTFQPKKEMPHKMVTPDVGFNYTKRSGRRSLIDLLED